MNSEKNKKKDCIRKFTIHIQRICSLLFMNTYRKKLPKTEALCKNIVSLSLHSAQEEKEVKEICTVIRMVLNECGGVYQYGKGTS